VEGAFSNLCCSVLQCVAVCCSVLQCVAVCCSVLQYVDESYNKHDRFHKLCAMYVPSSSHCSHFCALAAPAWLFSRAALQHTAIHCSTLQHTATAALKIDYNKYRMLFVKCAMYVPSHHITLTFVH